MTLRSHLQIVKSLRGCGCTKTTFYTEKHMNETLSGVGHTAGCLHECYSNITFFSLMSVQFEHNLF